MSIRTDQKLIGIDSNGPSKIGVTSFGLGMYKTYRILLQLRNNQIRQDYVLLDQRGLRISLHSEGGLLYGFMHLSLRIQN